MGHLLNVAAAFAVGALATYLAGDAMLRRRGTVARDDAQLRSRVLARLAELVTYPQAIEVHVEGGLVRVSGRVLAHERERLLLQLTQVPHVFKIYNALIAVEDARGLGALTARQARLPEVP